jgi:hypothetical protein
MLQRVAGAVPMAAMHGGLQAAPFAGRAGAPRVQRAMLDRRLGGLAGRASLRRSGRRSGGFPADPLGGADLTPYRQRAGALATMLERDRSHPRGVPPTPGVGPGAGPGLGGIPGTGDDLGRRLGLVRVGVEALVADLESVDAVEEEVRPLRELAAELARRLGPVVGVRMPGRAELARLRDLALAVLRAFAAAGGRDPGGPAGPGGPAPWVPAPGVPAPEPPSAPRALAEPRDRDFWRR